MNISNIVFKNCDKVGKIITGKYPNNILKEVVGCVKQDDNNNYVNDNNGNFVMQEK